MILALPGLHIKWNLLGALVFFSSHKMVATKEKKYKTKKTHVDDKVVKAKAKTPKKSPTAVETIF